MSNFLRHIFKRLTTSNSRPSHFLRPPQLTYLETRINPAPLTTTFTVSNLNSSGAGSLAEAIGLANDTVNYPTNDTIVFASSLFTNGPATISLTGVLPAIADATTAGTLTLTGPGANTLNISGNNGNFSIFSVATGGFFFISGVTVSGANFTSGNGGAFNNAGVLTISTSTISGNSATSGGGIFNQGTSLTISDSTISGNSASGFGGGMNNFNGGTISVSNSTISNNSATSGGGGIINTNSTLTVSNSTLFGNTTPGIGGGILNFAGSAVLTVLNSTLSGNSAGSSNFTGNNGGGINNYATINNLSDTIIANSIRGGDFVGNAPTVSNNNLITTGSLTGAATVTSAQLNLGPLQDNSGPTFTMALGAGSVAIGTTVGTGTDQRGINRTTNDIGAYSFGIQVTSTADSGTGSLRSAITQAGSTAGNDQISVNLTGSSPYTILLASTLPITAGFGTVNITGLGASNLNISGNNGNFSIFSIASLGNLFISGVTVTGVNTSGNGGAFNNSGTLTVSNSSLSGNTASSGGGIWNSGALAISNSTLSGNNAVSSGFGSGLGGAIVNAYGGTLNIIKSTLSGNTGIFGGGILNGGTLTVTNSTLSGNTATTNGGGIFNTANLNISNSTLSSNNAVNGGGIFNSGTAAVSNTTLSGNTATTLGAGLYNIGTGTLTNSTLSGNSASVAGGGIRNQSNTLTVINTTISGNSATNSGGGISNYSTLNITNTIIANSTSGGDFAGTAPNTNTNNLVEDGKVSGTTYAWTVTGDPLLGSLQDNGGPTFTMALLAGSPAIGTTPGTGTDQRGINRTTSDIGAYSFGIAVNATSDATAIDGVTSFREAITQANNTPGNDGISFNLTGSNTITLASALPTIAKASFAGSVTINGLGSSSLTITGNNGDFNFFNIATGGNLFVSGATISGAKFISGNGGAFNSLGSLAISASTITGNSALNGGGIINQGISLVVKNSIISNNTTAGYGGGINNYNGGAISISNSTISGNSATNGGGGIINTNSNLMITDSVFTGNLSVTSNGAGVLNTNGNSFLTVSGSTFTNNTARNGGALFNNGTATINSSTISGNINAVKGAGIYNDSTGVLTIADSVISNNASTGNGGGVFNQGSSLNMSNATISGNSSAANGGGVSNNNAGPFTISYSTISTNSAVNGGGIFNLGTSLTLANSTISGNSVSGFGGGINNYKCYTNTISVSNSTISNNSATNGGGGIVNTNSNLTVFNSTLFGNTTSGNGGGILNATVSSGLSNLTVTNSTLSGNSATSGGGIQNNATINNLVNTIIANSTSGGDFAGNAPNTNINNLVETFGTVTGTFIPTYTADPRLGPLQDNGGSTFTMALGAGSSAIGITAGTGTDQRGINRTTNDIGAYSFGIQVTTTSDVVGHTGTSLRDAITLANTTPGNDQISFNLTGASPYTITLAGALPNIIDATSVIRDSNSQPIGTAGTVNITGLGASSLTIDANGGNFRIFNIAFGGDLSISGVKVSGANNSSGNGGAFNNFGTLAVSNSTLSGNIANNGGGFYNSGTATFTNSTISGNSANTGGGAGNIGTLTISNSTISGNSASSIGGALWNGLNGNLTVINSTLSGNSASYFGGGIYNFGTTTVTNSTLSGNSANNGGGIYNYGLSFKAILNIANTIIANSTSGGDYAGTGTIGTNTNNLVEDGSLSGASTGDPKLGLLQNNGGPTFTMALLTGSAAISAGNSTISNAAPINGLDQRGFARTTSDIGDYSYNFASVNDAVVSLDNSNQVVLTLSSSGATLSDVHTSFNSVNNTLIITAATSGNLLTAPSAGIAGITLDNSVADNTITLDLNTLANFAGLVIVGNSGTVSVTIGTGGVDLSTVTAGGADQSLIITTGTGADSLAISNAINSKGNGQISLTSTKIAVTADITTTTGNIILDADNGLQQTGQFYGVFINGSGVDVITSGGNITIEGRGGDASIGGQQGVRLQGGAKVQAGGLGTVTVNGTGGASNGDLNIGVVLSASTITSSGGAVTVNGTGVGSGSLTKDSGIFVGTGSVISSGGTSAVTVTGTGGANGGNGVYVDGSQSVITSAGGDVTIFGTGGGTGAASLNRGVIVSNGGVIRASGLGTVNLTGIGGANSNLTTTNQGVLVTGSNSAITSSGGAVTVTGTAGVGSNSAGIGISTNSFITNNSGGAITLATDSIDIKTISGSEGSVSSTGTVTIINKTAGTTIDLGTGGTSTFSLTDDELDRITAGNLVIGRNDIGFESGLITVFTALTPALASNLEFIGPNGINLNADITTTGSQTYSGAVTLGANTTLNAGAGNINLPGTVSGAFSLTPITSTPGITTISGANTNTTTLVTSGVVQISNNQSTNYAVSGGTLKGTGVIRNLTATGTGIIAPGNSPGKISTTNLSLSSTNTLQIEITGTTPGIQYDQIVVTSPGTVTLASATLTFSSTISPVSGAVFTIIDNQGGSAVSGTFNGLQEGATVSDGSKTFRISYIGGTGNDVTLTVLGAPSITSIAPQIGHTGTIVGVNGTDFNYVSSLVFNGTVATFVVNSANLITTSVPANATTGIIVVTTQGGVASSSTFTIDNTSPTLSISSSTGSLKANETSTITFTFSEVVTGFSSSIITVTNGTLSSPVASSSMVYTATFTPTLGIKADGTISVSNNYFDLAGNQGTAATLTPPIAINTIQTPLVTGSASTTQGGSSAISLVDPDNGAIIGSVVPFPGFTGEIRVVSGDFNNDGKVDIIAAAGPGGGPAIAILDSQTGEVLQSFFAFDPAFTGGVFIAACDFNSDGFLDIIAGAGAGGGPAVSVFDGRNLSVIKSFFAYAEDFTGGVTVASIDFNNDGIQDLVTGAGAGGAPHVKVFDGATSSILSQWYAYPASFTGGVFVAAGDIGNDGNIEVVTGAGSGGAPVVAVWNPYTGALLSQFMAYAEDFTGGARVGVSDGNFDGILDLVTGAGPGGGPEVKGFSFPTLDLLFSFFSDDPANTGGVFVS